MPSGNGGKIALLKLGSLYSETNSVNVWTNFESESLEHKLEELEEGSINGYRDAPPSWKGTDHGQGAIVIEPNPNALGQFLRGWFGTHVASTITAAASTGANSGPFAGAAQVYHKFTPSNSAFSDRTFLDPYNVMVYRDVGSAFMFKQSIFNSVMIDIQAGQLVKTTINLMSRHVDRFQVGNAASLVSSGGRPWVWDMASIEISTADATSAGLAAYTNFEQLTFTFDLPHAGVTLLDGTKFYGEFSPTDFRRTKIEGTVSFRDQSAYDAFVAYENRRMRVSLINVNSNVILGNPASADVTGVKMLGYPALRLHIPLLKFTSWSAPITGPNRITAKFTAKAERSDSEGFSVMAELINIVSSNEYETTY